MPIRFRCDHCDQRLSVSSRKAGAAAKCPKCKKAITVPPAEEDSDSSVQDSADASLEDQAEHFELFDDSATTWVYEDDEADGESPRVDPSKLAVPRNIVYMQGALLGIVGLLSFMLGVLIGQMTSDGGGQVSQRPQPCSVSGTVKFSKSSGRMEMPDAGCVVIAVPQDRLPDRNAKVPIDSLRPTTSSPPRNDPSVLAIRSLGGDYARANANGDFTLQLPDRGKYYLLFVSNNVRRGSQDELQKVDLSQIGSYFLPAIELLGDSKYQWRGEMIRRNEKIEVVF